MRSSMTLIYSGLYGYANRIQALFNGFLRYVATQNRFICDDDPRLVEQNFRQTLAELDQLEKVSPESSQEKKLIMQMDKLIKEILDVFKHTKHHSETSIDTLLEYKQQIESIVAEAKQFYRKHLSADLLMDKMAAKNEEESNLLHKANQTLGQIFTVQHNNTLVLVGESSEQFSEPRYPHEIMHMAYAVGNTPLKDLSKAELMALIANISNAEREFFPLDDDNQVSQKDLLLILGKALELVYNLTPSLDVPASSSDEEFHSVCRRRMI